MQSLVVAQVERFGATEKAVVRRNLLERIGRRVRI